MDIATQVEQVLADRHKKLPSVRATRSRLETLESMLGTLDASLEALGRHPRAPGELRAVVAGANLSLDREQVRQALDEVKRVEARFSRATVNFGVSGQARVGKSTLLQALSGLDDHAIPTGTGTPVTAVRSRILSAPQRIARLEMHGWESFRDEVLAPYHLDLGLGQVPPSLQDFRSRFYPEPSAEEDNSRNVMLFRLRGMRDSLGSYERYLTGSERVVSDFSELRSWVAYPDDDEPTRVDNRYLAVRQAVIECPFPHAVARSIGLVDLPGLGEIAASAEEHHVRGLRDDVDFVLLVKRANEGMAYWTKQDGQARKLIDQARKPISKTSDFLGIVSNEGGMVPATLDKMLRTLPAHANVGLENSPIRLFRCQGKDPQDVGENLLEPALALLAERLPVMDAELLDHAQSRAKEAADSVGVRLQALDAAIARSLPDAPGTQETVSALAKALRQGIARDLAPVLDRLQSVARAGTEDQKFIASIREAHATIVAWANNALGDGEKWMDQALGSFAEDQTTARFATTELNRIRVHIGEVYCGLDAHIDAQTNALFEAIGAVVANRCARLLQGRAAGKALELLAVQLGAGDEPAPHLERAARDLLSLKVSYRSHFHPIVRSRLDILDHQYRDPETNELRSTVELQETTQTGARNLLRDLTNLAIKASASVRDALLRDAALMGKILHAAAEQFEDSFIRSGTSETEFARFARSWRDDLFPGQFDSTGASRFDVRDVKQALGATREAIDNLQTKPIDE